MTRVKFLLFSALLLESVFTAAHSQTFLPKTIQFKGDSLHSSAELMAASGLKIKEPLTAAEMNEHTKLLMDSGMFESINYAFDGQDLIFSIVPAANLYQPRYENFPFLLGSEFNARLHEKLPLYHGKVPLQGTLLDSVKATLKDELTAKGIDGTVSAVASEDLKPGETEYMTFAISSPPIHVGEIRVEGASPDLAPKARALTFKCVGTSFSSAGTPSQLEVDLGNFYHEQGYLEAMLHAAAEPNFTTDADGVVQVPMKVSVEEGPQYRLGRVQLAPSMVITQEAFDKQSDLHTGEIASLEKLRGSWLFVLRQYHNLGYMKAAVHATPNYDRAQRTVSYAVTADAGAVYTMGTLKITNGSEEVRSLLTSAWPMPKGATFNEGAIRGMTATKDVNPVLERLFLHNGLRYSLALHDDARTVDVDLSLERSH